MPSSFLGICHAPKPRTFTGQHVVLSPLDVARDVKELFQGSHESETALELWRYLPIGPFGSAEAMAECLRGMQNQPDIILFTVTDRVTGKRIGGISLMQITPANGVAELGFIWYIPSAQRTKANTEANYLLLRHCFEDLQFRRMEWKCNLENTRSYAAALRLGYRFEGVFRQHMWVKGRNRNTAWFSILDHEWPETGAALRQWLYEDSSQSLRTFTEQENHLPQKS